MCVLPLWFGHQPTMFFTKLEPRADGLAMGSLKLPLGVDPFCSWFGMFGSGIPGIQGSLTQTPAVASWLRPPSVRMQLGSKRMSRRLRGASGKRRNAYHCEEMIRVSQQIGVQGTVIIVKSEWLYSTPRRK